MNPAVNRHVTIRPEIAAEAIIGITTTPTPQQVARQTAQAAKRPLVASKDKERSSQIVEMHLNFSVVKITFCRFEEVT